MSDGNDTFTEVTSTGWFSRIGNSFKGIGMGFVLIALGTGLLYWNEGRAVRTGNAIAEAQAVTVALPDVARLDPAFAGKIVHATGRALTADVVTDPQFGVATTAIRLRRDVQFYQWVEHTKTEKRKKVGGEEETVTTYSYALEWTGAPVDSQQFKRPEGHENMTRIQVREEEWYAPTVTFGAYRLPDFFKKSMGGERDLQVRCSDAQCADIQKTFFTPQDVRSFDAYRNENADAVSTMVHPQGNTIYIGRRPNSPRVGDVRVNFFEVPAAEISLIATVRGDTFTPFTASNGESFSKLSMGSRDMAGMFADAKSENDTLTWVLRIVGLLLCIAGFKAIVAPLQVLADVIPLLGDIVGAGTGLVAGLLGTAWSLVMVAIAWIRFRPLLGACLLGGALLLIVALFIKGRIKKATVKAEAVKAA